MAHRRPLAVYLGHHKSASSWIEMIAKEVCRELRLKVEVVYGPDMFGGSLGQFVRERRPDFLAYSNANQQYVEDLGDWRGFHVVRDPRDICVSSYFSHLHSHPTDAWPELVKHRRRLQDLPPDDGLLLDMEFGRQHLEDMRSWTTQEENVLELRMEDITADPYSHFLRIFSFLGLVDEEEFTAGSRARDFIGKIFRRIEHLLGNRISFPIGPDQLAAERLLGIVWARDFKRLAGGRNAGDEDVKSHYRKGVAGDWKNYFKAEHVSYFKRHFGDLLLRYGYEPEDGWDRPLRPPSSETAL